MNSEGAFDMEVDESNGIALEMMDLVEDECIEHAFLDFMYMELVMEEVRVEPGEGLSGDEEWIAHTELDEILGLSRVGCHEDMVDGVRDDSGGGRIDKCSRKAYYGEGTWWLDRWLQGRPDTVAKDIMKLGHGDKNTLASDLLSIRIVQPRVNKSISPVILTTNNDINVYCSGPVKRPWSSRTGRWWPRSGQSWTDRGPWRSTSRAATRLRTLKTLCHSSGRSQVKEKSKSLCTSKSERVARDMPK